MTANNAGPGVSSERKRNYQDTLRALGGWLDRSEWDSFTLMELENSYMVLLERGADDLQEFDFPFEELLWRPNERPGRSARQDGERKVRPSASITLAQRGYSDFLRALGFELDMAEAYSVTLAKVGDDFLLTYAYLEATAGYNGRKRRIVIDADGVEEIMQVARSRRRDSALRAMFRRR